MYGRAGLRTGWEDSSVLEHCSWSDPHGSLALTLLAWAVCMLKPARIACVVRTFCDTCNICLGKKMKSLPSDLIYFCNNEN